MSPLRGGVPRTRTGTAWFGICTAAVALVVLIVFMLQNTRSVEVTFLWMHGSVSLALALLIAGVGVAVLAMAVGGPVSANCAALPADTDKPRRLDQPSSLVHPAQPSPVGGRHRRQVGRT